MRFPALPAWVPSVKGPVPVRLEADPRGSDGEPCSGHWDPSTRTITVETGLPLAEQWALLLHEMTHLALYDDDVQMPDDLEEAVCVALSAYLVAQAVMPGSLLRLAGRRARLSSPGVSLPSRADAT